MTLAHISDLEARSCKDFSRPRLERKRRPAHRCVAQDVQAFLGSRQRDIGSVHRLTMKSRQSALATQDELKS